MSAEGGGLRTPRDPLTVVGGVQDGWGSIGFKFQVLCCLLGFGSTVVGGVEDGRGIETVARAERFGRRHVLPIHHT